MFTILMIFSVISAQEWEWAEEAVATSTVWGRDSVVDENGNVYITGTIGGTATFGDYTLTASGSSDIYVAKMSSNGEWLWAHKAGGGGFDYGSAIALDESGYIYITGNFRYTASFGAITVSTSSKTEMFVAKLDLSGNWIDVYQSGIYDEYDSGSNIACSNTGDVYVAGSFNGTFSICGEMAESG